MVIPDSHQLIISEVYFRIVLLVKLSENCIVKVVLYYFSLLPPPPYGASSGSTMTTAAKHFHSPYKYLKSAVLLEILRRI